MWHKTDRDHLTLGRSDHFQRLDLALLVDAQHQ
jgi:hypothetical protein